MAFEYLLLEEHYKLGGLTPAAWYSTWYGVLEEHYKLGGLTPRRPFKGYVAGWKNIINNLL